MEEEDEFMPSRKRRHESFLVSVFAAVSITMAASRGGERRSGRQRGLIGVLDQSRDDCRRFTHRAAAGSAERQHSR